MRRGRINKSAKNGTRRKARTNTKIGTPTPTGQDTTRDPKKHKETAKALTRRSQDHLKHPSSNLKEKRKRKMKEDK